MGVGDKVQLTAPQGAKTPFGTTPRRESYDVVYVFSAGRYDIDRTRIYMPMAEAQSFFNREGVADEIEVFVSDPEAVDNWTPQLLDAAGERMRGKVGQPLRPLALAPEGALFLGLKVGRRAAE